EWLVYSLSAAVSVALVYLSLFSTRRWVQRVMTNRVLVYTGTISYGLYLLHKFPFDAAKSFHLDHLAVVMLPVLLGMSYVIAVASWKLLESPFLSLKRYFRPQGVDDPQRANQEVVYVS